MSFETPEPRHPSSTCRAQGEHVIVKGVISYDSMYLTTQAKAFPRKHLSMLAQGRAIAQAVSRRLATAAARVRARVMSCGICGGKSGIRAGFLRVLRFPLPIRIPLISPKSVKSEAGTIEQTVIAVPSGLSHSTNNNNNNNVICQPIVGLRNRALLGSRPLNASRPNTRYAAVGEAVFAPCRFEPQEVEDWAVPSRPAAQRFQGNDL
jgi:hypothetical protein